MRKALLVFAVLTLLLPAASFAASDEELKIRLDSLTQELQQLKQQMQDTQSAKVEDTDSKAVWPSWLRIEGDYRFRFDSLRGDIHDHYLLIPGSAFGRTSLSTYGTSLPVFVGGTASNIIGGQKVKNESLLLNRFGLNVIANPVEDVWVRARLAMYKVWGHESMGPVQGSYFADRANGPFDGSVTHVPQDNTLRVDYAYATWSNIGDVPAWLSIGRRPSTGGPPTYIRQNSERLSTTAGVQGLLVDYAFDGLTIGYAPDIAPLPGAFTKFCYGKGFDSGYKTDTATLKDVNFAGLAVVPYSTDDLHLELQANKGYDIFDNMPDSGVRANLGDITWFGALAMGKLDKLGPGTLNLFASAALSRTDAGKDMFTFAVDGNGDGDITDVGTFDNPGTGAGLLYDDNPMTAGSDAENHTGSAVYVGARYDIESTGTKIGAEYNYGSKYWIGMVPAGDDMWTSKLGTRGDVYEVYIIQELNKKPVAKRGKVFFRLGYQYYKFDYTGSNSWVGEPKSISDLKASASDFAAGNAQMFMPLEKAQDIYATIDVQF
ncbi:MAG: DUF3373 family protein [Nitrospirae bacterium]|nr:DUF3373 family protein [Nitrospirota bacterium]